MKKIVKRCVAISLALMAALSLPTTVSAGWVQSGNRWSYTQNGVTVKNGWKKIDGKWYYFKNGVMQTGWVKDNGTWYYLQGSGAMKTGWLKEGSTWYYLQSSGAMKTGWLKLGSTWYFLQGSGAMKTGWLLNGNKWYYLNSDGSMKTGWLKTSGEWYFMDANGVMQTSLIQVEGVNYDMGTDGKMKEGTPVGYPYYAYNRSGNKVEMILPKKNGKTATLNLWEGMSLKMMAQRLNDKGVCRYEDFLKAVDTIKPNFPFNKEIPSNVFYQYEGYLFPDIYEFYLYEDAEVVVKKMMDNFEKKMTSDLQSRIKASGMSFNEVMTLASIVQGEAPDQANMRKVAQIFINRLNNPSTFPKLQANPTTNYANQVILAADPKATSLAAAYDTYKCNGLPIGPINNPGLMAIEAVLNPDTSMKGYYFFCTDKVTKEFYYAKTWEEHKANTIKAGLA